MSCLAPYLIILIIKILMITIMVLLATWMHGTSTSSLKGLKKNCHGLIMIIKQKFNNKLLLETLNLHLFNIKKI